MSEEEVQKAAANSDPATNETPVTGGHEKAGEAPPEASPVTSADSELGRYWVKVGGWAVMALGVLTILYALHWKARYDEVPFLFMVGMIFSGISYVLAGQALGQGYQWPLPLAALACVFSPAPWLTIPGAIGFFVVTRDKLGKSTLRQEISSRANLAYGLWVAGFALALYSATLMFHLSYSWWIRPNGLF